MKKYDLYRMPGNHFSVGDFIYLTNETGKSITGVVGISGKKKLTPQQLINLKMGVRFSKVIKDSMDNSDEEIYRIIEVMDTTEKYRIEIIKDFKEEI